MLTVLTKTWVGGARNKGFQTVFHTFLYVNRTVEENIETVVRNLVWLDTHWRKCSCFETKKMTVIQITKTFYLNTYIIITVSASAVLLQERRCLRRPQNEDSLFCQVNKDTQSQCESRHQICNIVQTIPSDQYVQSLEILLECFELNSNISLS